VQCEKARGVVSFLREVLFRMCALCAEVIRILGNAVSLVPYEATSSVLRHVRGTLSDDCRCALPGAWTNLQNCHVQCTAFLLYLTGVCELKALFGPFYLIMTNM
jgi:hypothetical protein